MKLGFSVLEKGVKPAIVDNRIIFACAIPTVIQSSELKKVQTEVHLKVDKGHVLTLVTPDVLYEKGLTVFPGTLVLDDEFSEKLFIPLSNMGRDQVNIQPGMPIAWGFATKIEPVTLEPFEVEIPPKRKGSTAPAKKNADFKFEIR